MIPKKNLPGQLRDPDFQTFVVEFILIYLFMKVKKLIAFFKNDTFFSYAVNVTIIILQIQKLHASMKKCQIPISPNRPEM